VLYQKVPVITWQADVAHDDVGWLHLTASRAAAADSAICTCAPRFSTNTRVASRVFGSSSTRSTRKSSDYRVICGARRN
jgi:hypothetical protein